MADSYCACAVPHPTNKLYCYIQLNWIEFIISIINFRLSCHILEQPNDIVLQQSTYLRLIAHDLML